LHLAIIITSISRSIHLSENNAADNAIPTFIYQIKQMIYPWSIHCSFHFFLIAIINISLGSSGIALSESSTVSTQGIGEIKIGMTIAQASQSARIKLITANQNRQSACLYYQIASRLSGINFMVTNRVISRIDITNPRITTLSGAKIGDSEERIRSLYGNQLETKLHKYLDQGHYLIFVPRDQKDSRNQILFETDGIKVLNWRVGRTKEIRWTEGCS
jgi:hypothetical protein